MTNSTQELPELKPCPFCGSAAEFDGHGEYPNATFFVRCSNEECKVRPGVSMDEDDRYNGNFENIQDIEELYSEWNHRPISESEIVPGLDEALTYFGDPPQTGYVEFNCEYVHVLLKAAKLWAAHQGKVGG